MMDFIGFFQPGRERPSVALSPRTLPLPVIGFYQNLSTFPALPESELPIEVRRVCPTESPDYE